MVMNLAQKIRKNTLANWNQQLFTSDLTMLPLRFILKYKEFKNQSPLKEKDFGVV